MKDLIISGKRLMTELYVFLGCVGMAELVNAFAILRFDRPWTEMVSMIGYVLAFALIVYLTISVIRTIIYFAMRILQRFFK